MLKRILRKLKAGNAALARSVKSYLDQRDKITLKQWKGTVLPTLRGVENDILTRLKSYSLSEWEAANLTNILAQVQNIITRFSSQFTESVLSSQEATMDFAVSSLLKEVKTVGFSLTPVITDDLLAAIKPMTEVFTEVFSNDLARIVKSEITTGIINGDSTTVVAKNIRDNFGNTSEKIKLLNTKKTDIQKAYEAGAISKSEYSKKISAINKQLDKGSMMSFARAERIAMTEMNRAASFAREIRSKELLETNPEARRMWVNLHKPGQRAAHVAVENATRENPIKLDEPFSVNGYSAMFPRDPALPVGEVVNCGCTTVIVNPSIFKL